MAQAVIRLWFHPPVLRVEFVVDELRWGSFFSEEVGVSLLVPFHPSNYLPPTLRIISNWQRI